MKAEAVFDEFRRRVVDLVTPYLWSDDEVLIYANKAHTDFIRWTGGVRDSRGELSDMAVSAGLDEIDLDPRILKIVSARSVADGRQISVVGATHELARARPQTGRLVALVIGEDEKTLRPVCTPDADYTLKLVVDRLPLTPLTDSSDLEVRDEYAYDLVVGMMAHAYTKEDAETLDLKKAGRYAADFRSLAAAAFLEKRRRAGSSREVAYGGI